MRCVWHKIYVFVPYPTDSWWLWTRALTFLIYYVGPFPARWKVRHILGYWDIDKKWWRFPRSLLWVVHVKFSQKLKNVKRSPLPTKIQSAVKNQVLYFTSDIIKQVTLGMESYFTTAKLYNSALIIITNIKTTGKNTAYRLTKTGFYKSCIYTEGPIKGRYLPWMYQGHLCF